MFTRKRCETLLLQIIMKSTVCERWVTNRSRRTISRRGLAMLRQESRSGEQFNHVYASCAAHTLETWTRCPVPVRTNRSPIIRDRERLTWLDRCVNFARSTDCLIFSDVFALAWSKLKVKLAWRGKQMKSRSIESIESGLNWKLRSWVVDTFLITEQRKVTIFLQRKIVKWITFEQFEQFTIFSNICR